MLSYLYKIVNFKIGGRDYGEVEKTYQGELPWYCLWH